MRPPGHGAATARRPMMCDLRRERGSAHGDATRVAVGATRNDIVLLVLRHGAGVAAIGITSGLAIGMVATRSLRSILYGVTTSDPATLAISAALLALTVLLACYVPARRAASLDPLMAVFGDRAVQRK
jgi:putative ABC transport system permease protein